MSVLAVALVLVVLAAPLSGEAQPVRVARVGLLSDESPSRSAEYVSSDTLWAALRDLGWKEGLNVSVERRYSTGRNEHLPSLATELVRGKVDVIIAIGTPAALAAKKVTDTIPIVFARAGDPVRLGLVSSLARPDGNVTGVSIITVDSGAKRLELLREVVPGATRVGVLWDPSFPPARPEFKEVEEAARSLRLQLHPEAVRRPEEFEKALVTMTRQRADALVVVSGQLFSEHAHRLVELAIKAQLPMIYVRREFVTQAGGLMSYGPDYAEMYRRVAVYVDRILKGARPGDLPVEQPATVGLAINLRTARTLGLTIPSSLLLRADELVE
jgi:putative ABC transport system substrate-binding protein